MAPLYYDHLDIVHYLIPDLVTTVNDKASDVSLN